MTSEGLERLTALRVVVGHRCNQRCSFCYQRRRDGGLMTAPELAAVLHGLPSVFAPRFVTLMGGEPTLCPDLPAMVSDLSARFPAAELSVTSNGTATAAAYLDLARRGAANLTFSLSTLDPVRYPKITGQRAQTLETYLAKILQVRGETRASVRLNVYASADEVDALFRFAKLHALRLTFCEDLVSGDRARAQGLRPPRGTRVAVDDSLRRIYRDADGFEAWQYKHLDGFADYQNLIVLPDGTLSLDFADVLAQRGARS
ncbi:MAG TPA: radical SAM protein [Myxococcales bacterium]